MAKPQIITNIETLNSDVNTIEATIKTIPYDTNKTTNFTLSLADAGELITITNATANITATIPTNASVSFPIGTEIVLARMGIGNVSITNAVGVTLVSSDSKRAINKQYETASLVKYAENSWILVGSLKT